jgi:Ice-binding-like
MPRIRVLRATLIATAGLAVLLLSTLGVPASGATIASNHANAVTTPASCHQSRVPLGAAFNFRVLGATTVTNTGMTVIGGNLGVYPGSAVTGFPPGSVTKMMYKADKAAANGQASLTRAYNDAMGRAHSCATLIAGNQGGKTLSPGLYYSTSSLAVSSGDLTLDAHGNRGAVFIFQIASTLTMTAGLKVILSGGAEAGDIFWAVGSSATLGTTTVLYGVVLAHTSISMATGATLYGRALANTGAVTLDKNSVKV